MSASASLRKSRAVALQAAVWESARGPSAAVAPRDAHPRTLVRTAAGLCPRAGHAESVLSPVQPLPARGLPARAVRTRGPRQGRQRLRRVRGRAGAPSRGDANRPLLAASEHESCTQTSARAPAWNRPGDWYYRRTSERSSAGNIGRSVGKEWPDLIVGHKLAMVHILECALYSIVASKTSRLLGVNGNSNHACIRIAAAYSGMARIARSDWRFLDSTRVSTTARTPAHIGGLALLSPLPVLVSYVQSLAL
jgi:hypothetical protein